MSDFDWLFELDRLARTDAGKYPRQRSIVVRLLAEQGKHSIGVVGPRGVGKTIALKQLAGAIKNSFYLSADTLGDTDLFETVKVLREKYSVSTILIDEIHTKHGYPATLKKIFDFLDVRTVFTSSVSLALYEASVDLSRRAKLVSLFPFSFSEYVAFRTSAVPPQLTMKDILTKNWLPDHMRFEYLFDEYLKGGLMPFSLEEPQVLPLLKNILATVIHSDIPAIARLTIDELSLVNKCVEFIGKSAVDGINYTSLSRNVGITKYKAEQYVSCLEKAFVLSRLLPTGTSVTREPKILMCVPYRLLFTDFPSAVSGLREDYFIETLRCRGVAAHYLKSTRGEKTADFMFDYEGERIIAEIGGKGKGRLQFKGVTDKKQVIFTHPSDTGGIRRPLFMLGFLDSTSV